MTEIWAQAALWLGPALLAPLLPYAERHHVDHIVVGHRGHSRFDRWLTGSVAKRVVSYAPCAVTVVRPRA